MQLGLIVTLYEDLDENNSYFLHDACLSGVLTDIVLPIIACELAKALVDEYANASRMS